MAGNFKDFMCIPYCVQQQSWNLVPLTTWMTEWMKGDNEFKLAS